MTSMILYSTHEDFIQEINVPQLKQYRYIKSQNRTPLVANQLTELNQFLQRPA